MYAVQCNGKLCILRFQVALQLLWAVMLNISHRKRSNKETQSPMLKIFKDMMQNEKTDPEKTNLLKEKHVDKKRRHYSGSRSKSGHKTLSSSSDRCSRSQPFKMEQQETRTAELESRSRSIPFQNEKRESWWFWRDADSKSKAEDTCSCVSCALKKLINTDYACVACLVILFTVSVIVAIMLLYKSIPCIAASTSTATEKKSSPVDGERWKRKIDGLRAKFNFGSKAKNPFLSSHDIGLGSFNFQESSLVESNSELSRILDNDKMNEIQNSERLKGFYENLIKTDAAIRNLRKSLNTNTYSTNFERNSNIDFNSKIDFNNNFDFNSNAFPNSNIDLNSKVDIESQTDFDSRIGLNRKSYFDYPDRMKRSVKLFHRPLKRFHFKKRNNNSTSTSKIDNGKVVTKTTINMTKNKKPKLLRNKRYGNLNDTEGFVIEKNKVVVQYLPIHNRVVPKCSHAPKDSKSHETQLKHPFYKNTQRLDELLDQFIDKKLPDLLTDHFEIEMLKDDDKKCKHLPNKETMVKSSDQDNANDKHTQSVIQNLNKDNDDSTNENKQIVKIKSVGNSFENDFLDDSDGIDIAKESTTSSYDILLSISTLINPAVKRTSSHPASIPVERVPSLRKLMQVDVKEDEGIAYEDLKEVLADDKEGHDETDKVNERKKRNYDELPPNPAEPVQRHTSFTGVHNPNWKGPMPLYPDELNRFMKQEQNPENKVDVTMTNKNFASNTHDGLTDVEYVEDYLDNGYERLTQLAQAYSDYGVLDEKKNTDTDRKIGNKENQHSYQDKKRLTMHGFRNGLKRGLKKKGFFERLKKGTNISEGIRIELQPTSETREDNNPSELYKLLRNHVKITNAHMHHHDKPQKFTSFTPSSAFSHLQNLHFPYYSKVSETERDKLKKSYDPMSNEPLFPINKKRTLKSIEFDDGEVTDVPGNNFGNNDFDKSKFKREANTTSKNGKYNDTDSVNKTIEDDTFHSNKVIETKGNVTIHTLNSNNKIKGRNMTLSDFFMQLSNWFSTLDHDNVSKSTAPASVPRGESVVIQKRNNESTLGEMVFPIYDSDMIENIGHRSRVLLSVHVSNNTMNEDDNSKPEFDADDLNAAVSTTTEFLNSNTTNVQQKITNSVKRSNSINENSTKNRIVKRQAMDDSNLIFWNDLYDDEYGLQVDPFEKNIRDKHSIDKNDFLKKSNTWFQDKVKQIASHWSLSSKKDGKRISRDTKNVGLKNYKSNENYAADDEPGTVSKVDFKALTEKMREVCKKTVKDVQQTKNIQARGENKEGHVVTTLMQQLVRLMTDLVDYQVQERTCRRLPADLQVFLEWLTSSKQEDQIDFEVTSPLYINADIQHKRVIFEKPTENDVLQPVERNTDSSTDCLGTLHAVQDLIRQYEDMSDDDKSLMTGVKNYLENQMSYLQKQLSSINEYKLYDKDAIRYRRDASATDIAQTISDTTDVAVQTAENEYKHLKSMYKKYMKKLKHVSSHVTGATASAKEAVTKGIKKVNEVAKACKHKYKKIKEKKEKDEKNEKEDKLKDKSNSEHAELKPKHKNYFNYKNNSKDKVHLKGHGRDKDNDDSTDHVKGKDHKDKSHLKEKEHAKEKDRDDAEEGEEEEAKSEANHPNRNKDSRNIKDVYYKAVEEAKKASVKNTHKRSDIYDTTELFNIIN